MKDYRAAQPLSDDDFAEIRRAVLTKVGPKRAGAPAATQAASAFAALVVVLFLAWPRRVEVVEPIVTTTPVHIAAAVERRPEAAKPAGRRPALHGKRRHHVEVRVAMRVELQTADPDIRIIWITN